MEGEGIEVEGTVTVKDVTDGFRGGCGGERRAGGRRERRVRRKGRRREEEAE